MIKTLGQIVLLLLALFLVWNGFTGPQFAPKNLSSLFLWVHYRGILVLTLLLMGNYFCTVCPMMFVRNISRRFIPQKFNWPRALQKKWIGIALFIAVLFSYEYWDLWASPFLTALLILYPFIFILVVDLLFKKATFCKYICPIGQFNFVASTLSPKEVQIKNADVCKTCTTYECIKGNPTKKIVGQLGCELDLFLPQKVGNIDCTFCMECVEACPYENVHVESRLPAVELWDESHRAGVGKISYRKDILWLILIFTMGALLNAFGMVGPSYQLQEYMGEGQALLVLFVLFLGIFPGFIYFVFPHSLIPALLPLGFGMWLAHYSFHFFTGIFTFVPILQGMLDIHGVFPVTFMGIPERVVMPVEYGFILLGLIGSVLVSIKLLESQKRRYISWYVVLVALTVFAIWIMSLPMEMRGVSIGTN